MHVCGATTLVLSGDITTGVLGLLWEQVAGPSVGDPVTAFIRTLEVIASFSGTFTNLDRESTVLLHTPEIHSQVIL